MVGEFFNTCSTNQALPQTPIAIHPVKPLNSVHIAALHHNHFTSTSPALFNAISEYVKTEIDLIKFKSSLDKFLQSISEQHLTSGYVSKIRIIW